MFRKCVRKYKCRNRHGLISLFKQGKVQRNMYRIIFQKHYTQLCENYKQNTWYSWSKVKKVTTVTAYIKSVTLMWKRAP